MENVSARFIIKFKDDFLLTEQLVQKWEINIGDSSYFDNSKEYIEKKKSANQNLGNQLVVNEYTDFTLFNNFINNFIQKGLNVSYLYYEHPISIFNKLLSNASDKEVLQLANFYNYFDVAITSDKFGDSFEKMNNFIFEQLYPFEPIGQEVNFKSSPIEYVYVKGVPTLTESPSRPITNVSNLVEMGLPNTPICSSTAIVNLFDLETAWDSSYIQLIPKTHNLTPFFPSNFNAIAGRVSLTTQALHGKKVLGLISSKVNSNGVEGLLTDKINYKLSSIISNETTIGTLVTKEESSLLACLYDNSTGNQTERGSVILFEISTPPYPLEIQPAIFQLIQLATILGLVTIEPAGNCHNNFNDLDPLSLVLSTRGIVSGGFMNELRTSYFEFVSEYQRKYSAYPLVVFTLATSNEIITNFINNNSGAIIVGSYNKLSNGKIIRDPDSNYDLRTLNDSKVKIFAYGGGIPIDTTIQFHDTSAASALIAAIVVAIQSLKKQNNKPVLSASQMQTFLINNKTSYIDISTSVNGIIPDWNKIEDNI